MAVVGWLRYLGCGAGPMCHIGNNRDIRAQLSVGPVPMLNDAPILLAEDDGNDIFLMGRAFDRAGVTNPLFVLRNGQQVIDYLAGVGEYAQRDKFPLPGLVLLDLKMPWMDGFDVLKWIRVRSQFDSLPIVVLTSSRLQSDIDKSRQLGVFDFRVKPREFSDLVLLLDDVRKCWLVESGNRSAPRKGSS